LEAKILLLRVQLLFADQTENPALVVICKIISCVVWSFGLDFHGLCLHFVPLKPPLFT